MPTARGSNVAPRSFRFFDTRAGGTGNAMANALLGLFDDYTEFGNKPPTSFIGIGYDPRWLLRED